MVKYQVWSLDVWGHVPSECCAAYDCPCIVEDDAGEETHDENECQCDCQVNDRSLVGTLEVPDDAADALILLALTGEFLKRSALDQVEIDDPSCDGESIYVQTHEGRPIFQLEKLDAE